MIDLNNVESIIYIQDVDGRFLIRHTKDDKYIECHQMDAECQLSYYGTAFQRQVLSEEDGKTY